MIYEDFADECAIEELSLTEVEIDDDANDDEIEDENTEEIGEIAEAEIAEAEKELPGELAVKNPESEIDDRLLEEAKIGNEDAVAEIFGRYKNFVFLKSRNYFLMGAEKEDLIQEGMIGLLKAIRGYDKNKLTSFRTFASICIKRQLITAIKSANSQKNFALNSVVDLYEKEKEDGVKSGDDEICFYGKGLESYISYNPEEIYLTKEEMRELTDYLKNNLSGFEYTVFIFMIEGLDYKDIAARIDKNIKSIDNAMQRIKRKSEQWIKTYKEGNE